MARRQLVRSLKNITNGYTSVQIQVRNATSNDSWGPSSAELHEVALLTYHDRYFADIMSILEKRLNDKGRNWRHVMKALTIFLYCVYEGSEEVVAWLDEHLHLVKTLREFRYAGSRNIDQGGPIRSKARVLTELVEDRDKLAAEKENYGRIREQMAKPGIFDLSSGVQRATTFGTYGDGRGGAPKMSLDLPVAKPAAKKPPGRGSFEGRYSLSLTTPLHAIEEEKSNTLMQIASREVLNLD